jgi:hypothetical protein
MANGSARQLDKPSVSLANRLKNYPKLRVPVLSPN